MPGHHRDTDAGAWVGRPLGERTVGYDDRDPILFALAVGANPEALDLVHEDRLRVLPGFGLTLAQWAPDALGAAGAFDTSTAVHGAQRLDVLKPLPRAGEVAMSARVAAVHDKGSAAVFDVEVASDYFVATWSLFAPGAGGFGGERGPASPALPEGAPDRSLAVATRADQAVLYRLLGDRHAMHVDPVAARAAGQARPFMHGLCTVATTSLAVAAAYDVHPADLSHLEARFAAPVFPGEPLDVRLWEAPGAVRFEAGVGDRTALRGGVLAFC
ncbi:MaoC/PaaZ C-terminal domain-containing protein [Nocardioides sp. AE5]|uniref:MaoC/PaaZ C-terminal domain-containing protein n=1 Tax=Nocardioides sp. AE5 TaxID=2962573 RepID=UPI002880DB59|nr:MaoC/PaaZ C-terminal domain-containing protein [Nocardioides sp. AE5]MDT0203128.1 MaoC/PaaZ C-terminal domain-containing protein [Nocardioides sp. AE5]